jgi:hypothetical protein
LRWLDDLTEELEVPESKILEEELQMTVETAMKIQAERLHEDRRRGSRMGNT